MARTFDLNGREIGFFYSLGVVCDYSDYILRNNGGEDVSVAAAVIRKAVLMHEAYIEAHGLDEKPVTEKELRAMPAYKFVELKEILDEQEKEDSEVTIEAREIKNVKSGAARK